jgi:hypothetical protein
VNLPVLANESLQQHSQQQQQQQQSASFSNLMVLREHSDTSTMSTGGAAVEEQRSLSFDLRGRAGGSSMTRGQLLMQQQLIHQVAGREASSFSIPSSPSSAVSIQGINTSEPTSSMRSILASLHGRMHSGDSISALVGPQRSCTSFTAGTAATGVAGISASEIQQQLSGASDPGQGRSSNLSLMGPRHRTSGTMMSGFTAAGPQASEAQQGSASRFWSAIGFAASGSSSKSSRLADGKSIRGLRVRMGVASGYVPRNTNIARCALFELAKGEDTTASALMLCTDMMLR